ncbi:NAD(P)/FAD-dependent oxidoreductase [Algoriphagus sediminis]|uniref:FAD-dependent oxidoreductase n=1 Tax=Algoriphagus sediminis TaxID=3057113 RepID=A0ABT7Y8Q9_9BACT|nr:FAD-dependent oxidoreductase [Algoriphagus sediminis]MDN3202856.1 FAD-dependent oxidoreductase [Algoriphagus sediminis]
MLSYWEKKHLLKVDLVVVGAGFVGLSTAIHYKRIYPQREVLVLERGAFPTGASTRNAGFACFGSLTEILDDLDHMKEEEVLALVERRYMGLKSIRSEFGDVNLDYLGTGGFELLDEGNIKALDSIPKINQMLYPYFGSEVFSLEPKPESFGFSAETKAIVKNKFEGELDPGKYMLNLWNKANQEGVRILTGINVSNINAKKGKAHAKDPMGRQLSFEGHNIAVCTNAFAESLVTSLGVKPGRGLILLSKPMQGVIPWEGSFHVDKGYVYFRKIDDRFLIGGGRNIAFEEEETEEFLANDRIRNHLKSLTEQRLLPGKLVEWDMEWTGIMGFGQTKKPIIKPISNRAAVAVRLGGMGVAIGWQVGKEMSELLSKM